MRRYFCATRRLYYIHVHYQKFNFYITFFSRNASGTPLIKIVKRTSYGSYFRYTSDWMFPLLGVLSVCLSVSLVSPHWQHDGIFLPWRQQCESFLIQFRCDRHTYGPPPCRTQSSTLAKLLQILLRTPGAATAAARPDNKIAARLNQLCTRLTSFPDFGQGILLITDRTFGSKCRRRELEAVIAIDIPVIIKI